jgi:N-acetylneuraminate synthase
VQEKALTIGGRRIGANEPCFIIAEIGLNHNGDLAVAKRLVDAAVAAGADAVKFQKRKLAELYQKAILDQPRNGEQGLQYIVPLLVEFELSDADFAELVEHCRARDITFLCTPWDRGSVDYLESLGMPAYKIGSPDMTNFPLIEHVVATGKPLLVSTGMSTEDEIRRTLAFLGELGAEYALFHCVSTYPAAPEEINLRFMQQLREWSGVPVGYSGHDTGTTVSVGAIALGARMLEKHLTLDRGMRGPDHKASLEPADFAHQVKVVREMEAAMGVPHRWMTRGEVLNRRALAKSLVATVDIPVGTVVTRDMITSKSPGLGLSPQFVQSLVGRRMHRALTADEVFLEEDLYDAEHPAPRRTVQLPAPWGIVARFNDVDPMIERFGPQGMSFIEFHVSDRDLDAGIAAFDRRQYPYGLVVHAPEYAHDILIDLCSADEAQRRTSVQRIQKTIDLARELAPHFDLSGFPLGPKIVMHVGGMSPRPDRYDVHAASDRLLDALRQLDTSGVDLLLENLPPFPWYFGGRWFGHVLTDADNTEYLCRESGLGLCFDTSHASLECARTGASLTEFGRRIAPYVRHLHVSDGAGTSGEGLQIGDGDVNFIALLPELLRSRPTLIPEIWMGHHRTGEGFQVALEHLTDLTWASGVLGVAPVAGAEATLEMMTVQADDTILTALQRIDANRRGIAFVVDGERRVVGVVTDGDIRHGLVGGSNLHTAVAEVMTRDFVSAPLGMAPDEIRARLHGRTRIIPIVDDAGRLLNYASELFVPDVTTTRSGVLAR